MIRSIQSVRRTRLAIAAVLLAVLAGILTLIPSSADAIAAQVGDAQERWQAQHPSLDFDDQVDYQHHFRSLFDSLDSSDTAIESAMGATRANGSFERWGLNLTDVEHAELLRRERIQAEYPSVAAAAVGDGWSEELLEGLAPDGSFGSFAGRWIDQLDGGKLVIALAGDHPGFEAAQRRVLDERDRLVSDGRLEQTDVAIIEVTFTADDLHRVNREFGKIYVDDDDELRMLVRMSASMNEQENRVDLYAEPSYLDQAKRFSSQYPDGLVNVVPVAEGEHEFTADLNPNSDWGAGNWHAGAKIRIVNGSGSTQGSCMWGASARTSVYAYVVTAAHCLGSAYETNSLGTVAFWNGDHGSSSRRGVRAYAVNDVIGDPNGTSFVVAYHGSRGDIARIMITNFGMVDDLDCFLEYMNQCSHDLVRRELTTETEVGDVKCAPMASDNAYRCTTLYSNDAFVWGYDFLRQMNTNNTTKSQPGDSGTGWIESTLLTGITRGHGSGPLNDTYFTHAYYVENSGYLGPTTTCGTSGVCGN